MRIEHANITVTNVNASVAFYQKLFGAHIRWQGTTSAGNRAAHVGVEDTYLSLFEADSEGRAPAGYEKVGFNHLGFEVDSLDHFRTLLGDLGVEPTEVEEYEPGSRLYFFDPDGNEIELIEY
ncbi:VOC family protein [Halioglobus maricola]|uniref:VOC family protein n=1 Tax=Halioglobus maricola TaxID=2601894 RepID=A0A5P9NNP9_9GAMM|nr:VOC family protein [Halioglobus maricola]QFU77075.1 VOC family protein [Halioglobus maricola]